MRYRLLFLAVAVLVIHLLPCPADAQDGMAMAPGQNMDQMKFIQFPGLPTCSSGAVQNGDPAHGSSIILLKVSGGCSVPWHWHTPNEHLMLVTGEGVAEMKGGKSLTLQQGGYAMMAASQVHQFRCTKSCMLYLYSDGAFDLHYVDAQGKEISPDAALKSVKEVAVAIPK